MKKIIFITLLTLSITLTSCDAVETIVDIEKSNNLEETIIIESESDEAIIVDTDNTPQADPNEMGFGSSGALSDTEFTLEEMLIYAIQDEYAARAEYDYIINNFDITKPFTNIIKSEETHISLLVPLFDSYGFLLPEDTSNEHVVTITSVIDAFSIGVQAEILNISMYNLFLEDETLPDDVRDTFIKLRDASINHQSAFEKNTNK